MAADRHVRKQLQSSSLPLYIAVANLLRGEIGAGRWLGGTQLPTLDQLSDRFSVARVTMRQALGVLDDEGLIERVQGKGTFVAEGLKPRKMVHLESSWRSFMQMLDGNVPHQLSVEPSVRLPALSELQGTPAESYRLMRRVHHSDGSPYCVIDIYLAADIYALSPTSFDSAMVIPLLGRVGDLPTKRMTQSFRIATADLEVAHRLEVPVNAPLGEVQRLITDVNDRIIYLGIGLYRGDLVVFSTTVEAPTAEAPTLKRQARRRRSSSEQGK